MTYRTMGYSTNSPPTTSNPNHPGTSTKTRASPPSLLTTRGPSRIRPFLRTYFGNLTKNCSLLPPPTTSPHKPHSTSDIRDYINPPGWMRRNQSNSATENLSLLINCTPRLNNFDSTILPLPHTSLSGNLRSHNFINLPSF